MFANDHQRKQHLKKNIQALKTFLSKKECIPFSFYYFRDHFFDSRKRVKGKRKSGEVAEPDKPAHRQLGVRPHHVCDDSKVLAEYRIKDIEKFHSAMNEDF